MDKMIAQNINIQTIQKIRQQIKQDRQNISQLENIIQKLTDAHISLVDEVLTAKENDLMEI